jgi:hypothetical protein
MLTGADLRRKHPQRTVPASAVLLLALAGCAAPSDSGTAAEPIAFTAPGDAFVDAGAVERFVQDSVPRWSVYTSGRDLYRPGQGATEPSPNPVDRDRFCRLVVVPPGGATRPETWRWLSAAELWMKGDAYLTGELGLSFLDAVGIAMALAAAGPEPPPLPASTGNGAEEEEDPGWSPLPDDGRGDDHTWTGGPPGYGRPASQGSGARAGAGGRTSPSSPAQWPRAPSLGGQPRRDALTGVGPNDRPVGRYPGWDKPHGPNERWEVFRCRGVVYEGYKSDCPDFQGVPTGELWVPPFDQVVQHMADNARDNLELLRTDPSCLTICRAAVYLPGFLAVLCHGVPAVGAVPNLYAEAFVVLCAVVNTKLARVGAFVSAAVGPDWCEKSFCMPASGPGGPSR